MRRQLATGCRALIGLGVFFICAWTSAADADKSQERAIIIQLQWQPQAQFAGYMVAAEKGFYREAGLPNVKLRWWLEGESPFQLVADGKMDFCTGWLSQAIAKRAKGAPIVNIAQIMQRSALMLVARQSSGIEKPQDMTDKRVGLWGVDFDIQPTAFFKKYEARPAIVMQSASMVPFLRGAVDVASAMYYNEYHKLMEAGMRKEEIRAFFFSDYDMNFPEDGIYCTESTRRDRPDVCSAVVSASIKGWAYAVSHESEALDIVMSLCNQAKMPTNRAHQRWMLRAMAELIQHRVGKESEQWGVLRREDYENVTKVLRQQQLIEKVPPFDEFYRPALNGRKTPP
ncbi:MAG: ABC transporter substrate-binding protein [Planctomycetota bacterium]